VGELLVLAPFGVSPWCHKVDLTEDGRLVLMWRNDAGGRVRTFTNEETVNLLHFLQSHKDEIESGGKPFDSDSSGGLN
jgi:hypothetical protein